MQWVDQTKARTSWENGFLEGMLIMIFCVSDCISWNHSSFINCNSWVNLMSAKLIWLSVNSVVKRILCGKNEQMVAGTFTHNFSVAKVNLNNAHKNVYKTFDKLQLMTTCNIHSVAIWRFLCLMGCVLEVGKCTAAIFFSMEDWSSLPARVMLCYTFGSWSLWSVPEDC